MHSGIEHCGPVVIVGRLLVVVVDAVIVVVGLVVQIVIRRQLTVPNCESAILVVHQPVHAFEPKLSCPHT